jgi:hypothetical protein
VVAGPTMAQTTPAPATTVPADTVAAPAVAPATGGAAGLPASEFETYNVRGSGVRYTASLTGLYTTGTVERVFLSTSHTANFAFRGGRWRLPVGFNFSYGRQDGQLKERETSLLVTPSYQRGRFKGYALANAESSNLRAIDYRLVSGLGVGYQLYADTLANEIGLSYFLLREETPVRYRAAPPGIPPLGARENTLHHRASHARCAGILPARPTNAFC